MVERINKEGDAMRNHEGYYDPTAGKAIRRSSKRRKRAHHAVRSMRLTYKLCEVDGFPRGTKMELIK